jgi:uncharacterized protein UPF0149
MLRGYRHFPRLCASMSEAELNTLAEFLGQNSNPDALSLEGMDGFFCALIASPTSVLPHEYLPVIRGGGLPDHRRSTGARAHHLQLIEAP